MTTHPLLRARIGISLVFSINGAIFANLLPRYPQIKESLGMSDTLFGLVVACVAVGSLLSSTIPGPLVRRFGARAVYTVGTAGMGAATVAVGLGAHPAVMALALLCLGFLDACVDVAQNVEGIRIENAYGKSLINSMHALWSAGATVGGITGTFAASQGVPVWLHMLVVGLIGLGVTVFGGWLARMPQREPLREDHHESMSLKAVAWKLVLPLALIAMAGSLVEDVGNNWAALYLNQFGGVSLGAAGVGYVIMVGSQFVGRWLGDPMVDRFGGVRMARAGGVLIGAGGVLMVAVPTPVTIGVGFALCGFGCATLVPGAFAAAERVPGLKEGAGVTVVGWFLRLSFLLMSPLIGTISDASNLRFGIAVLIPVALLVIFLAPALRTRGARQPG
ncbi:MFS transporter [Granulicoccus phenolivorans]|uniref:MFS transporter n=1 Tax=Granulicoccus phenolivorans TaxID=266854 RepID=UPI00042351F9|nr:MFS transporter [Granulicoccus phenolivorans]